MAKFQPGGKPLQRPSRRLAAVSNTCRLSSTSGAVFTFSPRCSWPDSVVREFLGPTTNGYCICLLTTLGFVSLVGVSARSPVSRMMVGVGARFLLCQFSWDLTELSAKVNGQTRQKLSSKLTLFRAGSLETDRSNIVLYCVVGV